MLEKSINQLVLHCECQIRVAVSGKSMVPYLAASRKLPEPASRRMGHRIRAVPLPVELKGLSSLWGGELQSDLYRKCKISLQSSHSCYIIHFPFHFPEGKCVFCGGNNWFCREPKHKPVSPECCLCPASCGSDGKYFPGFS